MLETYDNIVNHIPNTYYDNKRTLYVVSITVSNTSFTIKVPRVSEDLSFTNDHKHTVFNILSYFGDESIYRHIAKLSPRNIRKLRDLSFKNKLTVVKNSLVNRF